MYKKILFLILFVFFSMTSVFSCSLDYVEEECGLISSSFTQFNLNIDSDYRDFEVIFYNKKDKNNRVELEVRGTSISNIEPILEPGVYVLQVDIYDMAGNKFTSEKEFVFDNSAPLVPAVSMNLVFETRDDAQVSGVSTSSNTEIFARVNGGVEQQVTSDENGNFTINLNSLNTGINQVDFYSKKNGIKSEVVKRVVYVGDGELGNGVLSNINVDSQLDRYNENTLKTGSEYETLDKYFYVSGTANGPEGSRIFINGVRAFFDGSRFAGFIGLNEGRNEIKVTSGNEQKSFFVTYTPAYERFKFTQIDFEKIVTDSVIISGSINYPVGFNVYLNGELEKSFNSDELSSGNFHLPINNLNPGKNYLYLEGANGESYYDIIYSDGQRPEIELASTNNIKDMLIFKIDDDVGIDPQTIDFETHYYKRVGNFFFFNVSGAFSGKFEISVEDMVSRSFQLSGNVNVGNTYIKDILGERGSFDIGKYIFINNMEESLRFIPSDYIAFKSIFVDGVEHIDYKIEKNGEVKFNLPEFKNSTGEIEVRYIDMDGKEYSDKYVYVTDSERPRINLDYIYSPYSSDSKKVRISGEITDSHFDWNSFSINEEEGFIRYGNNFEMVISGNDGILNILGNDYSGNSFILNTPIPRVIEDNTHSDVSLSSKIVNDYLDVGINSNDDVINTQRTKMMRSAGYDLKNSLVSASFFLPTPQIVGLIKTEIFGKELSGNDVFFNGGVNIDFFKPSVYYIRDSDGYKILVDGTYSEVSRVQVFDIDGNVISSSLKNNCETYSLNKKYLQCYTIDGSSYDTIIIKAVDMAENSIEKSIDVSNADADLDGILNNVDSCPFIYDEDCRFEKVEINFNANEKKVYGERYLLSGTVLDQNNKVSDVYSSKASKCNFKYPDFVCEYSLSEGENNLSVCTDTGVCSTFIVWRIGSDFNVEILDLNGNGIVNIDEALYFLRGDNRDLDMNAAVSNSSVISLIIDGIEQPMISARGGEFDIDINLRQKLSNSDYEELDLQIKAEDEYGREAFSDKITLIYSKVLNALINIVLN